MTQSIQLSIPDRFLAAAVLTESFPVFADINVDPYRIRLHVGVCTVDGNVWGEETLQRHLAGVIALGDRWRTQPAVMSREIDIIATGPTGRIHLTLDERWWSIFSTAYHEVLETRQISAELKRFYAAEIPDLR
ncbi:hypothetical protein [Mycetocola sp. JXN-3]|uniref:hypothetical protein n=1 Tax=Mycetocola sp. JXN-3 TaxID=2116510 RepID=UPI00165D2DDE|nr:hypothetical protein [Mycetocola sp. JXN-3]